VSTIASSCLLLYDCCMKTMCQCGFHFKLELGNAMNAKQSSSSSWTMHWQEHRHVQNPALWELHGAQGGGGEERTKGPPVPRKPEASKTVAKPEF
jgi:hypothetical protein